MSRREQHASLVSGASTERGWAPAFLLLALLWGASFMFIKVGLGALAPLQVALGRMVFGALFLLAVLVITKDRLPLCCASNCSSIAICSPGSISLFNPLPNSLTSPNKSRFPGNPTWTAEWQPQPGTELRRPEMPHFSSVPHFHPG